MTPQQRALIEAAENAAIWLANCTPIGKPTDQYPLPLLLAAISSAKAAEEGVEAKALGFIEDAQATLCGHDHLSYCNCDRCAARRLLDKAISVISVREKEGL